MSTTNADRSPEKEVPEEIIEPETEEIKDILIEQDKPEEQEEQPALNEEKESEEPILDEDNNPNEEKIEPTEEVEIKPDSPEAEEGDDSENSEDEEGEEEDVNPVVQTDFTPVDYNNDDEGNEPNDTNDTNDANDADDDSHSTDNDGSVDNRTSEEAEAEDSGPDVTSIKQCLSISETDTIQFGSVFPGQIKEQKFMIENESKKKLTLKVKVDCLNDEFDKLDEYVFSIRKPPQYDYNDTYYVIMSPKDFITFHVAIKVPRLRTPKTLRGRIIVTDENMQDQFETQIVAETTLPQIECPKMLFVKEIGIDVVMFNLKYLNKQEFRFPVKVTAPKGHKFTCEVEIIEGYTNEDFFIFKVIPSIIGLSDTNGTSQTFNIMAKATEKFQTVGKEGLHDIRKVLILRIANSSLIFSFPMLFKYTKKK